mmetsp:Transcript_11537/g.29206  ORF Transcript_11537/g.29206 Transcript_11537/m.29206 type:complete len:362 (+) Transcript_11537:73-1158(+)
MSGKRARTDSSALADNSSQSPEPSAHPQLLGLMLEMCAQMFSMAEQLARADSRAERNDETLARIEREGVKMAEKLRHVAARVENLPSEAAPRREGEVAAPDDAPSAARVVRVRASVTSFDDLPPELLALVAAALEPDEEYPASLSCCRMHAAVALARKRNGHARSKTRFCWALSSVRRLAWASFYGLPLSARLCALAAARGRLPLLAWLCAHGCPWDSRVCFGIAAGGQLALLQWARANGCPWDARISAGAAAGGHIQLLRWARANGCEWDGRTCNFAAAGGHHEVLQWARANGCDWGGEICESAARGGHAVVLKWRHKHGIRERVLQRPAGDIWMCSSLRAQTAALGAVRQAWLQLEGVI